MTDQSTRTGTGLQARCHIDQLKEHALLETVYRPPHVTTAVRAMVRDGLVTREPPNGQLTGTTRISLTTPPLALPKRCVEALRFHREFQAAQREKAGTAWNEHGLVFASAVGTERNANNVLRSFRAILKKTDLNPEDWTPREMRHSFVSVLSDAGVPIEDISRLAGHGSIEVTETVYWHQIRPALLGGAEAMDEVFPEEDRDP